MYIPLRARLLLHPRVSDRTELLIGAGFVQDLFERELEGAEPGASALLGLRVVLGRRVTLQVAGLADFIPEPAAEGPSDIWNLALQAGIGVRVGPGFDRRRPVTDFDGDGVADHIDACPNTRLGLDVDARGCARTADSDRDGVVDARDDCPDTPAEMAVDSRGCPSTADADADGVPDADDACPDTPAGTAVDGRGCPVTPDSDGDGVPDSEDACPGTLTGRRVDARGCALPVDSDGDGVADGDDACPRTQVGTEVDARGCPVAVDTDGDGVLDGADACPATPDGVQVDARGCPVEELAGVDTDGDGVPDAADRCPGSPAGEGVDDSGCQLLFEGGARAEILEGVTFVSDDTYELTARARAVLAAVARWMVEHPRVTVEVAGHTDNTLSYAQIRSLGRASAVRRYLMAQGVSGARILARGYGSESPIASNATASGRAQNNRIELRRLD